MTYSQSKCSEKRIETSKGCFFFFFFVIIIKAQTHPVANWQMVPKQTNKQTQIKGY